jgi:hypothetical protein
MNVKDTITKAYGNVPREPMVIIDTEWVSSLRGIKYYWIKFKRYITR